MSMGCIGERALIGPVISFFKEAYVLCMCLFELIRSAHKFTWSLTIDLDLSFWPC